MKTIYQILSVAALILSLSGNLLVNLKKRVGFIIWTASNITWIAVNLSGAERNISQILMFTAYIGLNIHGFISWKKPKTKKKDE